MLGIQARSFAEGSVGFVELIESFENHALQQVGPDECGVVLQRAGDLLSRGLEPARAGELRCVIVSGLSTPRGGGVREHGLAVVGGVTADGDTPTADGKPCAGGLHRPVLHAGVLAG